MSKITQAIRKFNYEEIYELYKKGKTNREVAKITGMSKTRVGYIIKEANLSRKRKPREHILQNLGNKCPEFSKEFSSYLDGLLISDGSLTKTYGCSLSNGYSQHCVKNEWLESIMEIFKNNGVSGKIILEKRKTLRKPCWIFKTLKYYSMAEFRKRWYPLNKKIVPKDLDFTNKSFLKNWLYGDGTLVNGSTLRLCTDSFPEEDVEYLIQELNRTIGVSFKKCYMGLTKNGRKKFRPSLCIRDGLMKFYKYIGECDIECFTYKWRNDV